ncbi:MAG TPA: pyridoxal 5'-phosphate synthase [Streptosporangiaceae bacterium]|nr:pyridoxal 5'-phosphate synthase [Streptosporangiaceae bacterium]
MLATVGADGRPSSRVVLLKEIADGALVFTSHTGSRKGRDLAVTPWASMTFYWRETLQQVTAAGTVGLLPDAQSDDLFAERPPAARVTTAVSRQSSPLTSEQELADRARSLLESGDPIQRPQGWGGYRLSPERIEFWQGRRDRLHRRLEYTREGSLWTSQRLQP